jgi:hypothetical protein
MRRVRINQLKGEEPTPLPRGETPEAIDRERKALALADFGEAIRAFLIEHGLDEAEFEAVVAGDAPGR